MAVSLNPGSTRTPELESGVVLRVGPPDDLDAFREKYDLGTFARLYPS